MKSTARKRVMRAMTDELHKKVKRRDEFECQKCGFQAPDHAYGRLEAHHIIPSAEGGDDEMDNLVTLCPRCHDYAPDSWRIEDYDRVMDIYLGTDMPPEADLAYFGVLLADRRSLPSGEPVSNSKGWRDVVEWYRDGIVAAENTHRMDGGSWWIALAEYVDFEGITEQTIDGDGNL